MAFQASSAVIRSRVSDLAMEGLVRRPYAPHGAACRDRVLRTFLQA